MGDLILAVPSLRMIRERYPDAFLGLVVDKKLAPLVTTCPYVNEVIAVEHGYPKNVMISRPDSFLVNESLRFVEFNCDSPAGCGLCDVAEEVFLETFPLKEISAYYQLQSRKRSQYLLEAILEAYRESPGRNEAPNIADC